MLHQPGTGKIARLPRSLRNELNQRLDDGHPTDDLLAWLNQQPHVKTLIDREFAGQPINPQNLTNWRQGGYQHWLEQQERTLLMRDLMEEAQELCPENPEKALEKSLRLLMIAELAIAFKAWLRTEPDPAKRSTRIMEYLDQLN